MIPLEQMTLDYRAGHVDGRRTAYKDIINMFATDGVRPIDIIEHLRDCFVQISQENVAVKDLLDEETKNLERQLESRNLAIDLTREHHMIAGQVKGFRELLNACSLDDDTQTYIAERTEQLANKADELHAMVRIALGG